MSIFDQKRLTNATFKLDIERMRKGWYTDKYFLNIAYMLEVLAQSNYAYPPQIDAGDLEVEMQWFTRRQGKTLVVGVDKALTMLRHCTGYFEGDTFVDTADRLQVWAVQDGAMVHSDGNPLHVNPVIRVRGRYRDFAILETPTLGILTRASRVASNVYDALVAARGKPMLFFPARFDIHEVQAADGYAYQSNAITWITLRLSGRLSPLTRRATGGAAQAAEQLPTRPLPAFLATPVRQLWPSPRSSPSLFPVSHWSILTMTASTTRLRCARQCSVSTAL